MSALNTGFCCIWSESIAVCRVFLCAAVCIDAGYWCSPKCSLCEATVSRLTHQLTRVNWYLKWKWCPNMCATVRLSTWACVFHEHGVSESNCWLSCYVFDWQDWVVSSRALPWIESRGSWGFYRDLTAGKMSLTLSHYPPSVFLNICNTFSYCLCITR